VIEIRPMTHADLHDVVSLHCRAFPNFFLSFLGPVFLRIYYRFVVDEGIALVAVEVDGTIAGFAAGALDSRSFYRALLRRRALSIGIALLPAMVRRPSTLASVLRRARQKSAVEARTPAGAELMSLAVDSVYRQRGTGRALIDALAARAGNLWLTTDAVDNDAVIRFYGNLGFARTRAYTTAEGRAMLELAR
jgi:ribosomal protein S18 acetylase RimI-like enzyme